MRLASRRADAREVGNVHENHQRDHRVEGALDAIGREVDVPEVDAGMLRPGDVEQGATAVDPDDVGASRVQLGGEPPVPAPEIEDPLAGDVAEVPVEEVVEPVDLRLSDVRLGDRVPVRQVVVHVARVSRAATAASTEFAVTPRRQTVAVDPVPEHITIELEDALRVLDALEDSIAELERAGIALGLRDELATVIRILHGTLGFDEGGV